MKKLFSLLFRSATPLILMIVFGSNRTVAQTPQYFKGLGTSTNTIPMNNTGSHCQQLYLPTDFNTLPISGLITKIYFRNSVASGTGTYANFSVAFIQNNLTAFPNTTFLTGLTTALSSPSITINGNGTAGGWYEIPLTTPFLYDNTQTLIVEIKYTSKTGGMSGYTTTATGNKRLSIITAPGPATGNLSTLWGDWGMDVAPAGVCTVPPTAGTATAVPSTPICLGTTVNLNLSGNSSGSGQTYIWQSAAAAGGPYTDISSSSAFPNFTVNPTTTTYYRAAVTCSGNTQNSVPVQVVVNPAFPGGTYTINSAVATGGTNYQTFADAVNALSCGIAGPVIFNVNAASGPYNEQVIIPAIGGASSTNTITFNGNGRTVTDNGTAVTGQRAVFKLDGADWVTINNFVINTGTGTYGYGVQMLNNADNNTVSNCIINTNTGSTSTTNYAGVLINSTASAITTAGASLCDNNTVSGNTINGGLAGVAIVANTTTSQVFNNKVLNNTITDFYNYGVYINGNVGTLIEGNDISRPARSTVTTFYGVFLTTISLNTVVSKNKFHDPFAGNLASASTAYAVDHVNCDATAGNENIVSNNLVYNFNGGTSTQNGFLCNGSDYILYYHNTVALEDVAATCTTCGTRGFYQQGTSTGITYKNNIVTIKRGGSGDKQGIFFEQGTLTGITLSNNDYYFYPGLAGLQEIAHLGLTGGTGYTTIASWQAGSGQEAGSVSFDPSYQNTATGDYHPTASSVNNLGTPVGILTDITGAARSATTPDLGAYEFNVAAGVNMGAEALITPAVSASGCYGPAETVTIRIRNSNTSAINFAVNPVTVTTNITGAATQTLTAVINSGTLGANLTMDVPMSATLNMTVAGTYTFNAFTTVAGDINPGNDAMPPASRVKTTLAAGSASASPGSYCVTPGSPTLSTAGAAGYGSLQWQQSTTAGSGFTDIPGATTSPYTITAPIAQTMYYRLIATCGGNTNTSNEVTVALQNPQVTGTTPGSTCGPGTVTLSATGSGNSTFNWYAAPTGGSPLGTGPSFTTPVINTNTTYYVSATTGGVAAMVGLPAQIAGTSGAGTTNFGLVFNVTAAFVLETVTIYPISATAGLAGTVTIDVINSAGTVVHTATVPVVGNPVATATAQTVSLNFNILPGTNYKLRPGSRSAGITGLLFEPSATAPPGGNYGYPFTVPGVVSITHSTLTAAPTNTPRLDLYYYFYDWHISTGCESSRTAVTATVTTPPAATITYAGSPYCTSTGTAAVTQTGTAGGVYSSTAGLSINPATGAINLSASTPGTYTVTYTIAASGGCPQFQTTTQFLFGLPPAATIVYAGSPYCTNTGTAAVTQTGTAGGVYSSTTGLSINPTTGAINMAASTAGTYTVTYTIAATGACPQFQTTASFVLNSPPSATIAYAGSPYCVNGGTATVTRTGSAGGVYSSNAGLSIDASTGSVNLAASTPGIYTVTYSIAASGACPAFVTTTSITVYSISVAATSANSSITSSCGPTTINLSITGGSLGQGASWKWYSGSCGGTAVGTGASLSNIPVTTTTTFYVRAEGICNNTSCASVTVTINTQPVISIAASPHTSLMPGMFTTLTATATPPFGPTNIITWYKNGVVVLGATGPTLSVSVDELGSYTARATILTCSALSNTVTINDSASNRLFISPNPNNGLFKVRYYTSARMFGFLRHLVMYNNSGQKVYDKLFPVMAPYSSMDVDGRRLSKGLYMVMVTDYFGEILVTGKVIIQ
ncbi:MAG TPA: hypothetical protein PKC54_00930 [Ferruginibacter sp.]|nr:hypothetical protein [Ferruginibacter sp.]